ncbi:hypothetical protein BJV85_002871 [Clostridium acetobutylicum]|uniref:Uncharacterized protein n=1 Tax=Clostridium acetobutylicum (strain ATCC 824 / DSM 792 / JCM 1419 / IAM 19013 / LMG 5710 / NBRC 13948 / NRRL B-527 / VKM B-1787 / 2291 / W) TaxID=272562 RepID=Q97JZ5_CLOAB|nr:hypothetical protein [Clostridium acetobutylicum]PSM04931.1 hypothetical protein C7T89_16415 [Clostridium sp. NJ4]AAK79100.1 Hypothetical protein CA_C1127 [Clostridium acetobutylicum ATCC 824]ADZ20176.1 Conserved hypothetical protein [Clostridium acetobutylicum EA 2018]AEI31637.1 hypothetical protein SMB_G1146 [Clostridium acetobutylicum DSM 1731]AWV81646.1 hypothetical protein DK921_16420 [Clostridium acetobutylicum]
MNFYIPPHINENFQDSLNSPIATSFILNSNSQNIIKAIVPEVDHRLKSGSSTKGTKPIYADINFKLNLGDYLQAGDDEIYIVSQLKIEKFPRCYRILTSVINSKIDFLRLQEATVDNNGTILKQKGWNSIFEKEFLCSIDSQNFAFKANSTSIGLEASNEISIQTQFNFYTKKLKIGDRLYWGTVLYEISSFNFSQVDINFNKGLLTIIARSITL